MEDPTLPSIDDEKTILQYKNQAEYIKLLESKVRHLRNLLEEKTRDERPWLTSRDFSSFRRTIIEPGLR